MAYFPVVGLVLGVILALINAALSPILPSGVVNLIVILSLIALTGAIHLDGLADTADGFFSKAAGKEEILNIMKDSRIGTMGVIAIAGDILLRYELLGGIPSKSRVSALILMCVIGRFSQALAAFCSKSATPESGIGRHFIGKVSGRDMRQAIFLAILICILAWFPLGVLVLLFVLPISLLIIRFINGRIGGMTGDTVGAISEVAEIAVLLFVLIFNLLWS
jgi:adenosylcobinamide-GDP ribazoletransferase